LTHLVDVSDWAELPSKTLLAEALLALAGLCQRQGLNMREPLAALHELAAAALATYQRQEPRRFEAVLPALFADAAPLTIAAQPMAAAARGGGGVGGWTPEGTVCMCECVYV
jgi:hypothetical protein